MSKLWEKGVDTDPDVLVFTTGDDAAIDNGLLLYDILGSLAHLKAILDAGVISEERYGILKNALREAQAAWEAGELFVTVALEDSHTALEEFLVSRTGEAGKTIHTGRSRNDQSLAMIRLYLRDALIHLAALTVALARTFLASAAEGAEVVIPGYTHHRHAMVSTWGLWAAAQAEGLIESIQYAEAAFEMVDRSPLGAGAGYGVPLALDRESTSARLGFGSTQVNVLSTQASRAKDALALLASAAMYAQDLARIAADLVIFTDEVSGFVTIPDALTTGSSIMPHKKNPDVLEILRARSAEIMGLFGQAACTVHGLPSGYHRDLQILKKPIVSACESLAPSLKICRKFVDGISVDGVRARALLTSALFTTDEVYRLVRSGIPFRDAYRDVAARIAEGEDFTVGDPLDAVRNRPSLGAPGNLALDELGRKLATLETRWKDRAAAIEQSVNALWS